MWILFAILTVLLWGTSETLFKSVSNNERHTVLKLIACNGIMMGIVALIYIPIVVFGLEQEISFKVILTYLPIAAIYIISMFCTYKAMRYIKVSIMSPVQNSSCVITTILCIIILHQAVQWYQAIGIVLIVVGFMLLATNKDETKLLDLPEGEEKISKIEAYKLYLTGIMFALGYLLLDGVGSFLDDYVLEDALSAEQVLIAYSLIYFVVGMICYLYLKVTKKIKRLYDIKNDKKKILGTLIETAGQYTYIYCFALGAAAIASPFIAAYSVVTIILSRLFLKEKLNSKQKLMIVMVMIGLILLSIEGADDEEILEEPIDDTVIEQTIEERHVEETILEDFVLE